MPMAKAGAQTGQYHGAAADKDQYGGSESFRDQFANLTQEQVFHTLKARLKPLCHRTLRRQVTAYIPFTKRLPLVQEFTPEEAEDRL